MPHSDTTDTNDGRSQAFKAELLYLLNLSFLPGLAFLLLLQLNARHKITGTALTRCHLKQTLVASVWAGILLIGFSSTVILIGGLDQAWTWVIIIIYFTSIHAGLILLGVVGLTRAQAGKHFHYPLIGPRCTNHLSP